MLTHNLDYITGSWLSDLLPSAWQVSYLFWVVSRILSWYGWAIPNCNIPVYYTIAGANYIHNLKGCYNYSSSSINNKLVVQWNRKSVVRRTCLLVLPALRWLCFLDTAQLVVLKTLSEEELETGIYSLVESYIFGMATLKKYLHLLCRKFILLVKGIEQLPKPLHFHHVEMHYSSCPLQD